MQVSTQFGMHKIMWKGGGATKSRADVKICGPSLKPAAITAQQSFLTVAIVTCHLQLLGLT